MLLAQATPYINPEITLSGLGIIASIIASCGIGVWRLSVISGDVRVTFAEVKGNIQILSEELKSVKTGLNSRLDGVDLELRQQTEILRKQDVMAERLANESKRLDDFGQHLQRLETAFSMFRVGSAVSAQKQVG